MCFFSFVFVLVFSCCLFVVLHVVRMLGAISLLELCLRLCTRLCGLIIEGALNIVPQSVKRVKGHVMSYLLTGD